MLEIVIKFNQQYYYGDQWLASIAIDDLKRVIIKELKIEFLVKKLNVFLNKIGL